MMNVETHILKIGGKVLEDIKALEKLLLDFSRLNGNKVIVHGGGNKVSAFLEQNGHKPLFVDGRRITDERSLEAIVMFLAGSINKSLVSMLQKNQINALGLTGADLDLIRSEKRPPQKEINYGLVGDIKRVNVEAFLQLFEMNALAVIAPITHDGKGQLLNTNADTIATEVASALSYALSGSIYLYYCFDLEGVYRDISDQKTLISKLNYADYQTYKEKRYIVDGMIPKLDNCFKALNANVSCIYISNPALLTQKINGHKFMGTMIEA